MQRYASRDDPDYKDILDWIKERVGEERQTRLGMRQFWYTITQRQTLIFSAVIEAPAESTQEKMEEEKGWCCIPRDILTQMEMLMRI